MTTYDREMQDPEFAKAFNKTRIPRKLNKRYKKMGIWSPYLNIASIPVMNEDEFREFLLFEKM